MKPYTKTVNMNHAELKAWAANPRHLLASTATGHESLRRLVENDHYRDPDFAQKADNFNTRHALSGRLFGTEVGKSGWSKRHIALRNWGHDPSKPDSPLYDADQVWLEDHAGAEARRKGRAPNPAVISSVVLPERDLPVAAALAPFLALDGEGDARLVGRGLAQVTYVPTDYLYGPKEHGAEVAVDGALYRLGLLNGDFDVSHSLGARRTSGEVLARFDQINDDPSSGCLCQMRAPLQQALASRYDKFDRAPNPAIGAWILPIAQLLVSASGLYYSVTNLAGMAKQARIEKAAERAGFGRDKAQALAEAQGLFSGRDD